ncbi:DMT family transporter [Endozoicomonas montiporae]|uniref:DMT family transporter n=1 Tax=Endozoicomonas montiporae TaxID=1027273 RepID=UPI0016512FA9|nr:DMT family transporter [Endozoicomonas montiporae]
MNKYFSSKQLIPYIKLAVMSFFFGGVFVAGRTIAGDVEPAMAAFLRFAIATVMLIFILLWKEKRIPVPTPTQFIGLTALGLTGVLGYNLCLLIGLETVSSGRSSVIVATNPVFITFMSVLFLGDQLTRRKLVGIGLSVSGAVLVASHGSWNNLMQFSSGDLSILVCAICWASYSVIGKYVLKVGRFAATFCAVQPFGFDKKHTHQGLRIKLKQSYLSCRG